ncbi:MAG TPA: electron transport complex subunit RsxA [Firmicutes bacterium]|jgi:electron transport complex protein RnfA|nr:electron transport complex subunit RsxA [Bacillota bacterium]
MTDLLLISFGAIFINNFVLARFLGICPFLGVSKKLETAVGMGLAVTFVMTMASAITYGVYKLLVLFDLEYLDTITFILVIAVLVQFVEMILRKYSPGLYQALGIYLPLITTNCAVLGVAIINIDPSEGYSFIQATVNGFSGGVGFTLAIILFAGLRERLEFAPLPKAMEGFPIALILAGLISIAFLGFSGFRLQALLGL